MRKKTRVSPKNIQFQDTVQIKEIPRDEQDSKIQESWGPYVTEEVFIQKPTKQKNVIIAFVICGTVLLVVVIGTVLGVVLTQNTTTVSDQSLTYNQVCTTGSNQCKSSQGLSCPNGFCSCTSPYSWNQITSSCTLLTFNQACSSSNQCNSSLGLSCQNETCQCINPKIWNISACVCPAGTFLNSSNFCVPAYTYNDSCVIGSNQCDSTRNLTCNANTGLCQCDPTNYWDRNFEICLLRLNYSQACSDDSDCIPTLSCPPIAGVCNCPQYLPDYVCNCNDEQYYDSTISQCVSRATYNGVCIPSTNYTCLSTLYCNAGGECTCPLGTNWIAANSSCA